MDESDILKATTFNLSMTRPGSDEYLTANVYTVKGVTDADGELRPLSIGQLVMAICLSRASELEASIVSMMNSMNAVSAQLELMTQIEQEVVDWSQGAHNTSAFDLTTRTLPNSSDYAGDTYKHFLSETMGVEGLEPQVVIYTTPIANQMLFDDFITAVEAKMDSLNSFSQQKMIELQSLTSKRDQSYDMISNMLKSLNTVNVGIVNNM